MTQPSDSASERFTDRREFIGQIAASAIVLAGGAACAPAASTGTTPAPVPAPATPAPTGGGAAGGGRQAGGPPAPVHWDDSWFSRITTKHKAVFDSPQIEDGLVLANASGYIRGMRDAIGAGTDDVIAVVVIRHMAVPMIFNDAMWEKYKIGEERKIKAPNGGDKWATKNDYVGSTPAPSAGSPPTGSDRPQGTLSWLAAHGHILLGCDLATRGVASILAKRAKVDQRVVYEDLKANLVPGVILQPTGVYAVMRAQEAGCTYIRST